MPTSISECLRARATQEGFSDVRITSADTSPQQAERLRSFLGQNYQGDMDWLAETAERRAAPRALWPEARSAIVFAMNYGQGLDAFERLGRKSEGVISTYALNRDYHDVVKGKLKKIATWFASVAKAEVKVFVDTAPLMEKPLAHAAGLGWQGKHTNLLSRELGSWFFIGTILTDKILPVDEPEVDHCGSCHACLDICPTKAFPAPYQLDARRCISYLTIEHKGAIPEDLRPLIGNRVYGCDDCQLVCPWNKYAQRSTLSDFDARVQLGGAKLIELWAWSEADFLRHTEGSAVRRIGFERWQRNLAVGMGNALRATQDPAIEAALDARWQAASPLVREHIAWALAQGEPAGAGGTMSAATSAAARSGQQG